MVATLAPVASTDAAELYYLDNQASVRPKADYYAVGKEPDGVWLNPAGLFDLPDRQRVTTADFHSLFWGFSPADGAKLSRNAGSASRSAAIDITFSADKSISALWAIAGPELRAEIERAHNDAARESYERWMLGECAHTRRTNRHGALEVVPADLIGAMFQHGENREQEPHLHTHVVCFNIARARDDGKYRTHHQHPAFAWVKTMGAWYRAGLAWNLQERLGIRMEQYGANNEFTRIAAMPEELMKSWSTRTGQIHAWARTHGVNITNNPGLAQAATLNTRKHKNNLGDRATQFQGWLAQAKHMVPDLPDLMVQLLGHDIDIGPEDIRSLVEHLRSVPDDLMRAEAVVRLPAIAAEAANRSATKLRPAAIDTAVARVLHDPQVVELEPKPTIDAAANLRHTEIFTTKHTLHLEETVTDLARSMVRSTGHGIDSAAVDTKIAELKRDGYPVSDEQIAAIRAVATSEGRIAVIEGAAGSGKTTTLRPLADLWREAGRNITATAVPWRTATALGTDVDAPMYSVAKLLNMAARNQLALDDRSIVIVDEAGMLSTREIHHLMQLSERTGAKFLFCGDTQQQQPVEAGPGLRLVRDVVGSSRIAMIRRQKPDIEDVLRHQRNVSPDDARAEAETMTAAEHDEIVAEFEASPQAADRPFTPWQITASGDFRDGNTREAIAAYRDRGRFHLCRNMDATIEKLADDVARYTDENPHKSVAVLARTNAERRALSLALRRHALGDEPRNAHVVAVSDRQDGRHHAPLEIAVGDRLRIGATHWQKQLFNGSIVIVDDLHLTRDSTPEEPRVRIHGHTEDGRSVSFDHDEIRDYHGNVRLDHGYALTITSAQGLTVDAAFLLADSRSARQTIYPAATRHRERLNIYVDRQAAALEVGLRRVDHDKVEQIVTDDQIVEHLEKSWTRSSPKQAAHDYRVRQARAPRPDDTSPTPDTPASAPEIDRLVRDDRQHALELVHGNTIAALASGRRKVLETYADLRARAAAGENIADDPAFLDTLDRHAALVTAAETFRIQGPKFATLLKRRGGLTNDDLQDFRHHLKRARDWRRGRVLSKTIAGRRPQLARRRGSTPPRVDRHRPLPDHVADAIERDIEGLVPAGPAVGASVTSISPAADPAPDAGADLAAAMALDPAHDAPAPASAGDAHDEPWSDEDLEHYAQAIAATAAVDAPDTDADLPEDPGWAEYAASLDARTEAPHDPTTDFPAHAPQDDIRPAPHAPPQERPAPTPAPPAVQPTAAELYERFITRFRDHRRRFENTHLSPWRPQLFRSHLLRAREALQHPDLSGSMRAAIQEILDAHTHYLDAGDRLTALAEDLKGLAARFKSMCDETHRTGARLIDHPDYPDWYDNAKNIRKNDVRSLPGYASWLKENPHVRKAIDSDYDQFRLNNRLTTRIVEVRAQYDDFVRRCQAVARKANHNHTMPSDSPDHPALRKTALTLRDHPHLPLPQRAELQNFIAHDLVRTATRDLAAYRAGLESIADQSLRSLVPLDRHPRYAEWRERAPEIDSSVDRALTACSHILDGRDRIHLQLEADRARLHERHDLAIRATRHAPELARFAADLRTRDLQRRIADDLAQHLQGLPAREHPVIDGRLLHYAETPQYMRWAKTAKALLDRAQRVVPAEFLEGPEPLPEVLAAIHRPQRQLEDILDHNTYAIREDDLLDDLRHRTDEIAEDARRDGVSWIDHPNTPELLTRADLLIQRPHATSEIHDFVHALGRDYQAAIEMRERRDRLIRLDADLSDHLNNHKTISREADRHRILPAEHRDYEQWSHDLDSLKRAVDELFNERGTYRGPLSPEHDYVRDTRIRLNARLLVHTRDLDVRALANLSPRYHPAQEPAAEVAPSDHIATPDHDRLNLIEANLREHLDAYETIRRESRREHSQIYDHPGYKVWSQRADALVTEADHILHDPDADRRLPHPEHDPELATLIDGYAGRLQGILTGNMQVSRSPSLRRTQAPAPEPEEQPKRDISPDPDRGPGIGF